MKRSFIEVEATSHFPIQNLPYGVFKRVQDQPPRVGVAIGDYVLDLSVLHESGFFNETVVKGKKVFHHSSLNQFMALGKNAWKEVRDVLQHLLDANVPDLRDNEALRKKAFVKQSEVQLLLPVEIGDYTDFYASKEHATNVGMMFRGKDRALMPNWTHLPVAYHGRASSVVLSGTNIYRPQGQKKLPDSPYPIFGPSERLDIELEMGYFIGTGNSLGEPIPIEEAEEHIFGLVLVNDWSARDIQTWEYQPLGPFLAKNFATSISPWVVPLEALEPFRIKGVKQEPKPLPYLQSDHPGHFDINLQIFLKSKNMDRPQRIANSNFRYLYWSMAQQIAHHTITGCNLKPGDLLATGTISGPEKESRGCLLELTWNGKEPIELENGEKRVFLQDGDEIILSGYCQGENYRVGFGEVTGKILPAKDLKKNDEEKLVHKTN